MIKFLSFLLAALTAAAVVGVPYLYICTTEPHNPDFVITMAAAFVFVGLWSLMFSVFSNILEG